MRETTQATGRPPLPDGVKKVSRSVGFRGDVWEVVVAARDGRKYKSVPDVLEAMVTGSRIYKETKARMEAS